MFERIVSVSEVSCCPPHHNVKPQGVSVHLHSQLPTHNPASCPIGIWKNTVIMGTLCWGFSFVIFHIIHSCLCCLLKPSKKGVLKDELVTRALCKRFKSVPQEKAEREL